MIIIRSPTTLCVKERVARRWRSELARPVFLAFCAFFAMGAWIWTD